MLNTISLDTDRVNSLFEFSPLVYEEADQPKRKVNKNVITAELKILREQKRVRAMKRPQQIFREEVPLCRFN